MTIPWSAELYGQFSMAVNTGTHSGLVLMVVNKRAHPPLSRSTHFTQSSAYSPISSRKNGKCLVN